MSRNLSIWLVAVGVVLIIVALIEHFALRVTVMPHLAIGLGVITLILFVIGAFGLLQSDSSR